MSAGLATIPSQYDEDSWQGPVLESGARSVGVLTDTQQQAILTNQTYNGSNDNDGDGVVNHLDSDDDNDCIPDSNDSSPMDFDGDGINDESDIDDDGDGLNDSLEVSDSNASTNIYDADNDGNHDCAFFSSGSSSGGNNTGGNNTGGNNSGGNNSGGNNNGGNNNTCHASNGPEYNLSLDSLIYHPTDTVNAVFNFFCMDNKAGIYTGVSYWVYGPSGLISSTFYVHNTSTNYNFWDLDNRSNNFSETGWLIPTGSGNMSVGSYYVYSELWDNNTHVDTANVSFSVSNSSSNGGNNNSGCGHDYNYASVYAYSPYSVMENQSFLALSYVLCDIYDSNMSLTYWIYDVNNSTIYSGNLSWAGSGSTSHNNWSVPGLGAGTYTFQTQLYVNNTFVDSDNDLIYVYANNTGGNNTGGNNNGCGYNTNYTTVNAYTPYYVIENQSFITSVYVQCEIIGASLWLDYSIVDYANNLYTNGNLSWTGTTNLSVYNWTTGGLPAGNYTFQVSLYSNGSIVASNSDSFIVLANNSGGNNTGGNNTNQLTYYAYLLQYCFSSAEDIEIFMTISGLNATEFYLEWEITSGSTLVASGSPLISVNSSGIVSYAWTFNTSALNSGIYTVMLNPADSGLSNLFSNSPFYYNIEVDCNNTGGNNTGGNNTGGNNTGGNNTGGNNTGGNNTGGNNTGGNNTGGNTSNPCGSDLNYSTLMVGAYQLMTPMLYENDTFTGSFRPMCALSQMNHSFTGHLQGPNTNDYSSFSVDIYLPGGQTAIATQYQSWLYLEVGFYSFHVEWNLNQSGTQTFVDEGWFNFTVIANNTNSPGSSQSNPLMPFNCSDMNWNATGFTLQDCQNNPDSFWFVFNNTGGTFWIDPVVAIGYDYIVWSGPNIRSVTLPTGYGDDIYDLYMWNTTEWYDTGINIDGGETYTFTDKFGVDRLSIRGIEASEELDPNNPTAFVTGLSFTSTNEVMMTMTPVTVNYTSNNTGGNNTGGNNTGGNNTGGNNTGGNNTGGNNTGGNNTGGDNTGGNNTGGNNTGGNNTVIPNTAPSVSGVSISPVLTTADDTLTCAYTITDLDGDITTATVTWSVNGNIILTGSDSLTGGFAVGDNVICSVTANDGQQPSTAASASTVILPVPNVDSEDGEGLPALGTIGTMAAIAAGVFASRRKDE